MNVSTKIMALVAGSLLITAVGLLASSSYRADKVRKTAAETMAAIGTKQIEEIRQDSAAYRQELLAAKKDYLQAQVATVSRLIEEAYHNANDLDKIRRRYEKPLADQVRTVFGILEALHNDPSLSQEEQQARARAIIRSLRYGDEGKDYFWINDTSPTMVMHPYKPELEGKDLSGVKDPDGKPLFIEMVKVCREQGEGFVDYRWPKYGADQPQPKLSYVKLFKPWGWIVGTGVYLEAAEAQFKADVLAMLRSLRYGPEGKDYFWVNDTTPTMVMHPYKPELEGKDLSGVKDPDGKPLFVDMVATAKEHGAGFVDYRWPKYGADQPQPKLSYVKLFEPWGWVIGTGIYIDDIDVMVAKKEAVLDAKLKTVSQELQQQLDATNQAIAGEIRAGTTWNIFFTGLAFAAVLAVTALLVKRSVVVPIRLAVGGVDDAAVQMNGAAGQVSAASQQLAAGASQQAASLEEVAASMEEITATTKQNADNAAAARARATEESQVLERVAAAMDRLDATMAAIKKRSDETGKIIATIDAIAFQTNLLALNAAVEAARAGEAGAGFAVVADEVRNLAQRASQAAADTATLIGETVERIGEGGQVVEETRAAFQEHAAGVRQISTLVEEIATASHEQTTGIDQIAQALQQLEGVTQSNAAAAEESAAAAEELSAQSEELKRIVAELGALVGNGARKDTAGLPVAAGEQVPGPAAS